MKREFTRSLWNGHRLAVTAGAILVLLLGVGLVRERVLAGGPIAGGGGAARGTPPEGEPFLLSTNIVAYNIDGGSFGTLDNDAIKAVVAAALQKWTDVPTSSITFTDIGPFDPAVVPDGDVDTVQEFTDLVGAPGVLVDCGFALILDADGSLFQALGIGGTTAFSFGGACNFDTTGETSGLVVLNGGQFDGNSANGELPPAAMDELIMHEFGHLMGLNHSQLNVNCFTATDCATGSDDAFGYPTMTTSRVLASGVFVEEAVGLPAKNTLATDDIAWISMLYPETVDNAPTQIPFTFAYGIIEGQVLYSDGVTGAQRVNIIARPVDDPGTAEDESRRNAVSATSGQLFTAEPGNPIINADGDQFGSRDPALKGAYQIPVPPGTYRVEIESYSVTPPAKIFSTQIPSVLPVLAEFYGGPESDTDDPAVAQEIVVAAGVTVPDIDIIMNGTAPRFDSFDAAARNEDHTVASLILSGQHQASISPFDAGGADEDTYAFDALSGAPITVETVANRSPVSSPLNTVIEIMDITGARLMTCRDPVEASGDVDFNGIPDATPNDFDDVCANDDIAPGSNIDSLLEFDAPTDGTYFVRVSDRRGDARPDFLYDLLLSGATAPSPSLDALSQTKVDAGSGNFTLTVTGADFVPNATVRWNGADRATTFVSGTELQAAITGSDIATGAAAVPVTVLNPAPGGGETGALQIAVTDFVTNATPASATVTAGQSALYTVSLAPQFGSYDSNVSLSCAGLPTRSSCTFSPATLTPGGSTVSSTLTINTTASGAAFPITQIPVRPLPLGIILLSLTLALAGILFRQRAAMPVRVWALGSVLAGALLLAACGGGSKIPGTPAGSFNVTVNATAGSFQSSATVSLVVE